MVCVGFISVVRTLLSIMDLDDFEGDDHSLDDDVEEAMPDMSVIPGIVDVYGKRGYPEDFGYFKFVQAYVYDTPVLVYSLDTSQWHGHILAAILANEHAPFDWRDFGKSRELLLPEIEKDGVYKAVGMGLMRTSSKDGERLIELADKSTHYKIGPDEENAEILTNITGIEIKVDHHYSSISGFSSEWRNRRERYEEHANIIVESRERPIVIGAERTQRDDSDESAKPDMGVIPGIVSVTGERGYPESADLFKFVQVNIYDTPLMGYTDDSSIRHGDILRHLLEQEGAPFELENFGNNFLPIWLPGREKEGVYKAMGMGIMQRAKFTQEERLFLQGDSDDYKIGPDPNHADDLGEKIGIPIMMGPEFLHIDNIRSDRAERIITPGIVDMHGRRGFPEEDRYFKFVQLYIDGLPILTYASGSTSDGKILQHSLVSNNIPHKWEDVGETLPRWVPAWKGERYEAVGMGTMEKGERTPEPSLFLFDGSSRYPLVPNEEHANRLSSIVGKPIFIGHEREHMEPDSGNNLWEW